jgi:uncharacterized membrane protein
MTTATQSTEQLQKLSESNKQTLANIISLMEQEGKLFKALEAMDKTPQEKQMIINQINELSQLRLNLHKSIRDIYSYYQSNVDAARTTLGQQLFNVGIMENELNEAKRRINDIQAKKQDKLRLVQINTYYNKKYSALSLILAYIVVICVILLIIGFLKNRLGVLPSNVALFLVIITVTIGLFILFYSILDISNRDTMNFDEYNWYFDKSKAPDGLADQNAKDPWSSYAMCVNSQCCDQNSDYNAELNKCVAKPPGTLSPNTDSTNSSSLSNMYTGLSQFAMGLPNTVTTLVGNDALPMETMQETFSNFASF